MFNLANIERQTPEGMLANLRSDSATASIDAAAKLIGSARDAGLGLKDYLRLAIDPTDHGDLNGYEAALAYLNLPVRDDLDGGVMLQAASDTFQTFPGTRALFPEVIDDMLEWKYRQTNFETVEPMVSQIRTVAQPEMIHTIVDDEEGDYTRPIRAIAERGRIPVHSIRTTQQTTKFWKFGMGYATTYEFNRRASLDILTPYAARAQREIEIAKVSAGTSILVNGDGVHGAAPVVTQSSYNGAVGTNATAGRISYQHMLHWLVARAQAGYPIDTAVGNWDAYLEWLKLFAIPRSDKSRTDADDLAAAGFQIGGVPILQGLVNFVLSSQAPAGKLIGYSRADTLEMQVEAGSLIEESENSIKTQEITYVQSENSGFRIVFDGTRSIYDFAN